MPSSIYDGKRLRKISLLPFFSEDTMNNLRRAFIAFVISATLLFISYISGNSARPYMPLLSASARYITGFLMFISIMSGFAALVALFFCLLFLFIAAFRKGGGGRDS